MAQPQSRHPTANKPSPPPVKPPVTKKPTRQRKIASKLDGSVSTLTFLDGSASVEQSLFELPSDIQLHLMHAGFVRTVTSGDPSLSELRGRIGRLAAGEWQTRTSKPKLPDPLAQALANLHARQGIDRYNQSLIMDGKPSLSEEAFTKRTTPEFWQAACFGPRGMSQAARSALRAKNEVQAEIRLVKAQRAGDKLDLATLG